MKKPVFLYWKNAAMRKVLMDDEHNIKETIEKPALP